ncbi:hypothetical protein E4T43_08746 [Aureobasidium subglaciale]|nr:hypothetical protein E4T43_08746 [Aureobasidium subglaciale]
MGNSDSREGNPLNLSKTPGSRRHRAEVKMNQKQTKSTLARSLTQPPVTDGLSLSAQRERLQALKGSMQQAHDESEQRAGMKKKMSTQGLPQYRHDGMGDNQPSALPASFITRQDVGKSTVAPGNSQPQQTESSKTHGQAESTIQLSKSDELLLARRARANANANLVTKVPSQPLAKPRTETSFGELMAGFDADKAVQSKGSPVSVNNSKLVGQPLTFRKAVTDLAFPDDEQETVQESSVQQQSPDSLLDDKGTHWKGVSAIDRSLPFHSSLVNGEPFAAKVQPQSSPAPLQQPAPIENTQLTTDDDVLLNSSVVAASPSHISDRIDSYIVDALGDGLDDHVHNIFKNAMMTASLWSLQDVSSIDHLIQSLYAQIGINERNARVANKSLEAALDSYDLMNKIVTLQTTEHCRLLDKQELERQESLEDMLAEVKESKNNTVKLAAELSVMKDKLNPADSNSGSDEDSSERPEHTTKASTGNFSSDSTEVEDGVSELAKGFRRFDGQCSIKHVTEAAETRKRKRFVDSDGVDIQRLD